MLSQNSFRESPHAQETQDILTIHQKIFKAVFRYHTLHNFSKQFNLDCESFYQFLQEDQHKFGALMFCPHDLPIHVSAFLKNLSKWITKTQLNLQGFQPFRTKNLALRDSMIEKETLMIFQATKKGVNAENIFAKFEKTKGKLEKFVEKYQQRKIGKVVLFLVSSQQASCDEKEVSWEYPEFVGGIHFEFGGILHLPSQLYCGGVKGLDRLLETFFGHIRQLEHVANNERMSLQQEGQLQYDLFRREREIIAREREEIAREKEEIQREKEEIFKERDELHRKREEISIINHQQIDHLTSITNRYSGLLRDYNQSLQHVQPTNPVEIARVNPNVPDYQSNYITAPLPKRSCYSEPVISTPFDSSAYFTNGQVKIGKNQNQWNNSFV